MLYGGLAASAGFVSVYASLYYAAMHPKAPKPAPAKHRIACVGDSITYGYGLMGAFRKYCYPTQLQKMLGNSYQVLNFGICDRTLQNGADKPYRKEAIYKASLASSPETVIIMLGTNDAKPHNWNAERYRDDLRSLVNKYRLLDSKPKVVLMAPPKTFSILGKTLDSILDEAIGGEMREAVKAVAGETSCEFVDLYEISKDHREWSVDGLHLNKDGTYAIASAVKEVL